VIDCTFRQNHADAGGGAIYSGYQLSVTGSGFYQNTAASGGAIDTEFSFPGPGSPQTLVSDSRLAGNTAIGSGGAITDGDGAAGLPGGAGDLTISDSKLTGNTAGGYGGAIDQDAPSATVVVLSVADSQVAGNVAGTDGGGIYVGGGSFAAVRGGSVTGNRPDNCASAGAPVAGCTS
jgi:predicted outer membrane repeat protein